MQLNLSVSNYKSWIKVRYERYMASYVADLCNKSLASLSADIKQIHAIHDKNFVVTHSAPIATARGFEAVVVFSSKPLTFNNGGSNATHCVHR